MKAALLLVTLCLALPDVAHSDMYLKRHARSEFTVDGQVAGKRDGDVYETWIGDGRIASHEGNKTILLDLNKKWFCIVNHPESTFVECSLPLEPSEVLSDDIQRSYEGKRVSGVVERTDRTRELAAKECREYKVTYWDVSGDSVSNSHKITIWATEEVSFDETVYYEMLRTMRILHNRDKKVREDLEKIKGLQTGLEMTSESHGVESKFVMEAVEISEKEPPEGIYDVPEGYAKKDRLTDRDF